MKLSIFARHCSFNTLSEKMETVLYFFFFLHLYICTHIIQKPSHVGAWQQVIQRQHRQTEETFKEHLSSLLSRIQNNLDKIQSIVTQRMQFREMTDDIQIVGTKVCEPVCAWMYIDSSMSLFWFNSVSMVSMCIPQNPSWSEVQAKATLLCITTLLTM